VFVLRVIEALRIRDAVTAIPSVHQQPLPATPSTRKALHFRVYTSTVRFLP
jgi:hypothetical protein